MTVKKKIKPKVGILQTRMQERYKFDAIFDYNPNLSVITTKFNVVINGVSFPRGRLIYAWTSFGGLNLFNYIGRDIGGVWDRLTSTLTIIGFY